MLVTLSVLFFYGMNSTLKQPNLITFMPEYIVFDMVCMIL